MRPATIRTIARTLACFTILAVAAANGHAQSEVDIEKFFRESIGLTNEQIAAIRSGKAVSVAMKSRVPAEVFVFGAVYVDADPAAYVSFTSDFDRLRNVPGYMAINGVGNRPQLSDFNGLAFDAEDIQALKNCKPTDCDIQMPAGTIAALHQSIDWSAPNLADRINQRLRQLALDLVLAYQEDGNRALGVYNDKPDPTEVSKQFAYMLSYSKALPQYLPNFNRYLLDYPSGKPANVEDSFYWSHVKFGLKPTLRLVQVVTMRGAPTDQMAYAIAEKQLYSSHYFQTALDLTFCIRDRGNPKRSGFYLIKAMGSEQAGLTGVKGSIVRKVAVDRSVTSLQKSLAAIKDALEKKQ